MSEKIITAHRHLTCDLCGRRIPKGTQCRMIRDDFMPFLVFFEHLRCPSAPAVVTNRNPRQPIITKQHAFVLA